MSQVMIEDLCNQLTPVRRVSLVKAILLWIGATLAIGVGFMYLVGVRPDLMERLREPNYIVGLLFYGSTYVFAGYFALSRAIPDASAFRMRKAVLLTAGLGVLALLSYASLLAPRFAEPDFQFFSALGCCLRIALGATVPVAVLLAIYTRIAPTNLKAISACAWISSAALVSVVSQLNCPIDDVYHIIVGHGLLLAVVSTCAAAVTYMIGKTLARKNLRHRLAGSKLNFDPYQ